MKITCENETRDDARLMAELAAEEKRMDQEAREDRAEAIRVAGPVPAGWAYAKAVRDPYSLTRQQRRRGDVPPISGWLATRPATREWLFGTRKGVEEIQSGSSSEPKFFEDWTSREVSRKRLEVEIAVAKKEVTQEFNGTDWVPDYETAFLADGRPFARRNFTGADGWLQWSLLDVR